MSLHSHLYSRFSEARSLALNIGTEYGISHKIVFRVYTHLNMKVFKHWHDNVLTGRVHSLT